MGCGQSRANVITTHRTDGTSASAPSIRLAPQHMVQWKSPSPVTKEELAQQRSEFWHTRVTGNAITWNVLRSAAEAVITGDFELANALIEASNITIPLGTLEVAYDELGTEYKLLPLCYSLPANMSVNSTASPPSPSVSKGTQVQLAVRVYPGEHKISLSVTDSQTILHVKHQIREQAATKEGCPDCIESRQRILYMGKELKDSQTVADACLDPDRVLQVYLRAVPT